MGLAKEERAEIEVIGSGIIIRARSKKTGRLMRSHGKRPMEHRTLISAVDEVSRLEKLKPHLEFEIYARVPKRS